MKSKHIMKKIGISVFVIFIIISINFTLIRFMPGDPVMHIIGEDEFLRLQSSAPEVIERIRGDYGLDHSILKQYTIYMGKTLVLDFGNSYRTKEPVMETVVFRMKWTLALAIPATVIAGLLGGACGLMAGWRKGGRFDSIISPIMIMLQTVPSNCLAILFLLIFAFELGAFPISGITSGGLVGIERTIDILWHMVLPLSVLALLKSSGNFMLMKSTISTVKEEEYITVARSRGMTEWQVMKKHALKNVLSPYITYICMQFGSILAGSMMIEIVFSWKGMGTLIYDSVNTKDFPMLQTCFLFMGICIVVFNLIADVLVMAIDHRVKDGEKYA